jgi:hypothetical protein
VKGILFDALLYQETLDPTRPAIFQTVSLRCWMLKGLDWRSGGGLVIFVPSILITGPVGAGKTTVAIEASAQLDRLEETSP